jgi:two-component system, OmpR family, sensor kinase
MKPLRMRTQLTAFYAGVSLLTLLLSALLFYQLLAYQLDRDLVDDVAERSAALRGYLSFKAGEPALVYDRTDTDESFFIQKATRYYQIFRLPDGVLLVQSPELKSIGLDFTADEVHAYAEGPSLSRMDTDQLQLLLHNHIIRINDDESYLLQVGVSLESKETALGLLLKILLGLVPFGVLVSAATGWYMSGRVLQPVESLGEVARQIGISNLDKRLPVRGTGDELDRLAITFNQVFSRLEQAVSQMREFTSSISHELRTPLTALRGEAEVALSSCQSDAELRKVLESQLEEFDKLTQLINQMLMLARAEAGEIVMAQDKVPLSDLAASLVEQMQPVAAWKKIDLNLQAEPGIHVVGDARWLERVLLNLLDNAIKFTDEQGKVSVHVLRRGSEACVEVYDTGIGISEEALPRVFDRFYRADSSRSREVEGSGLGLSLADWIVRQHGGRIEVESRPKQGSLFRVVLPCPGAPPVSD